MNIKRIPKTYKKMHIRMVKSKDFVAHWSAKTIFINYWYVIKPKVTWEDVKAVFEHELEERRRYTEKHEAMITAHSNASIKEKKILKKFNMKYGPHQKEIIDVYRKKATRDAPYMDLKHP